MEGSGQIYAALAAIMRGVGAVAKDQKNPQQGYMFRGIDGMYNALHDLMAEHGVVSVPEVLEIQRSERESKGGGVLTFTIAKVRYTFFAPDGSFVHCTTYGEGMDSGDKSSNKALAGAHKYALVQTFAIPTEDSDDSENESPEPVAKKTSPKVEAPKPAAQPPKQETSVPKTPEQLLYLDILREIETAVQGDLISAKGGKQFQAEMNASMKEGGAKTMEELEGVRRRVRALWGDKVWEANLTTDVNKGAVQEFVK